VNWSIVGAPELKRYVSVCDTYESALIINILLDVSKI
jgi:hypothetical protein